MNAAKLLLGALAALALGAFAAVLVKPEPRAPAVELKSLDGGPVRTAELRGKVLVVTFWSTTCGICLREMPHLVERHRDLASRGYETIAIATHQDDPGRVRELVARKRLPYTIAFDEDASAAKAFGDVRLTPTTFVIDRQGRILRRYVGRTPWEEFDALVRRALKNNTYQKN